MEIELITSKLIERKTENDKKAKRMLRNKGKK